MKAKKPRIRFYCKYCYKEHTDWELFEDFDQEEYYKEHREIILMCKRCAHSSPHENTIYDRLYSEDQIKS